jgi:hypothetical protein
MYKYVVCINNIELHYCGVSDGYIILSSYSEVVREEVIQRLLGHKCFKESAKYIIIQEAYSVLQMLLHHKKWNYRSKRAFRFAEIRSESICVCSGLELCSIGSAVKGDISVRSVRVRHNEGMTVVIADACGTG